MQNNAAINYPSNRAALCLYPTPLVAEPASYSHIFSAKQRVVGWRTGHQKLGVFYFFPLYLNLDLDQSQSHVKFVTCSAVSAGFDERKRTGHNSCQCNHIKTNFWRETSVREICCGSPQRTLKDAPIFGLIA